MTQIICLRALYSPDNHLAMGYQDTDLPHFSKTWQQPFFGHNIVLQDFLECKPCVLDIFGMLRQTDATDLKCKCCIVIFHVKWTTLHMGNWFAREFFWELITKVSSCGIVLPGVQSTLAITYFTFHKGFKLWDCKLLITGVQSLTTSIQGLFTRVSSCGIVLPGMQGTQPIWGD